MKVILFIGSLLPKPESSGTLPPGMELPPMEPAEDGFSLSIPEPYRSWFQVVLAIVWIGLFAAALWRVSSQIYQWLKRKISSGGAETEPIRGAFTADLISWLKRIVHYLSWLTILSRLQRKPGLQSQEVVSVRHIYSRLLHWGAARGYPRQRWD